MNSNRTPVFEDQRRVNGIYNITNCSSPQWLHRILLHRSAEEKKLVTGTRCVDLDRHGSVLKWPAWIQTRIQDSRDEDAGLRYKVI